MVSLVSDYEYTSFIFQTTIRIKTMPKFKIKHSVTLFHLSILGSQIEENVPLMDVTHLNGPYD